MVSSDDMALRLYHFREADGIHWAQHQQLVARCSGPGWAQRVSWAFGRLCIAAGERLLASNQASPNQQSAADDGKVFSVA